MMTADMGDEGTAGTGGAFRLRGEVDGMAFSATVAPGKRTIGSSRSSDIYISVAGISRHHAVIELGADGLFVEDQGSKNGTFVNGARLSRGAVRAGDWVQFGPAAFLVEALDPRDAQLAIEGRSTLPVCASLADQTETEGWSRRRFDESPRWMELVNRLLPSLIEDGTCRLPEFLAELAKGLGAAAAALVEIGTGTEPVVVAAWGEAIADAEIAQVARAIQGRKFGGISHATGAVTSDALPLVWATAALPGEKSFVLVVVGEFPHRSATGPLLEIVLRTILRVTGRVSVRVRQTVPPVQRSLVFPDAHVPGHSRAMLALYSQLRELVRGDIPVLITGETGVGKEHVARTLHASSHRAAGPFVAVNCTAIPSELLEAELFGIEAGVATGVREREGKFRLAAGGVLFLDEIGDMPSSLQGKLLRALEAMEVHPVGAKAPVRIDVRLLTATNSDLTRRLKDGSFRRDLYYRIAGCTVRVPPLRDRRDDVSALVEHFLEEFTAEVDKRITGVTVKALQALVAAPWPGNVRELAHEVRRLVTVCPAGSALDSSMLLPEILAPSPDEPSDDSLSADLNLERHAATLEKRLLRLALARSRGNRTKAARMLGLSRPGLLAKLRRHSLDE
ncbi:MAG: sigma 54-interacting transcriptional regulator [Acidobacteria bacterium]|nr:sigma 54-interacting transcriptional regulator [Acidobacteriota bacterium]